MWSAQLKSVDIIKIFRPRKKLIKNISKNPSDIIKSSEIATFKRECQGNSIYATLKE
jgi:hypothetical protein